jgi:uncharacterized protein
MTEAELHRALLSVHDREYGFVLEFLNEAGFELPLKGPIAYRWGKDRALAGDAKAQFCVAKLLSSGLFVKQDRTEARKWCEAAANQNLPQAITMLGSFYESGWGGLEANSAKSIELFKSAAELGEPGALSALAGMNLDGRGLPLNYAEGVALLRRAARTGDKLAQCELGLLLLGDKDPQLESEGLRWLREAASNGISTAHRRLGFFYQSGSHGLPVDNVLSRKHLDEAAKLEAAIE